MKRVICILILSSLLCACATDAVPVYESQEAQPTSTPTEAIPLAMGVSELPDGEQMFHLSDNIQGSNANYYKINNTLQRYDETLDKWEVCCVDAACGHMGESCTAWFGQENVSRRFAVVNGICYCAEGTYGMYALDDLTFYAVNPATGEQKTYFSIDSVGEEEIYLGNVAICGQTAILSYSLLDVESPTKTQHIKAIDLRKDSEINIMEREILNGEVYELWGMNETHIILSYLHSGGNNTFSDGKHIIQGLDDHSKYIMDQRRWVLLEFPLEENAQWSEQIAQYMGGSELRLFNHGNFYYGTLYYALNDTVWAYDLQEHKNTALFKVEDLQYMSCLDGKILYLTEENESFSFELANGKTSKISDAQYFPVAETETGFYCEKIRFTGSYGRYYISKENFYEDRMDAIRCVY